MSLLIFEFKQNQFGRLHYLEVFLNDKMMNVDCKIVLGVEWDHL